MYQKTYSIIAWLMLLLPAWATANEHCPGGVRLYVDKLAAYDAVTGFDWQALPKNSFGQPQRDYVWLKIVACEPIDFLKGRMLFFDYTLLSDVHVYTEAMGGVKEIGYFSRFERAGADIFPFILSFVVPWPADQQTLIARVESKTWLAANIELADTRHTRKKVTIDVSIHLLFSGILVMVAVFYGTRAVFLKRASYYYYSCLALSHFIYQLLSVGFFSYLYPEGFADTESLLIKHTILWPMVVHVLFALSYLNFSRKTRFCQYLYYFCLAATPVYFFFKVLPGGSAGYAYLILGVMGYLTVFCLSGILLFTSQPKHKKIFLIGMLGMGVIYLLCIFSRMGGIESDLLAMYGVRLGVAFELALITISLGYEAKLNDHKRVLACVRARRSRRATRSLEKLNQELQEEVRKKSEFVGKLNHELKVPLHGIRALIDCFCEKDQKVEGWKRFELMRISLDDLEELVDKFLTLSQVEINRINIATAHIDLRLCLLTLVERLQDYCLKKGVELIFSSSENQTDCAISSDPYRIGQIIKVLIDNALRHACCSLIEINLSRLKSQWLIRVTDNGAGISAESRPYIFDRYFSASGQGSMGMGLYIASALAEGLGGRLELSPSLDLTQFVLTLPMCEVDESGQYLCAQESVV